MLFSGTRTRRWWTLRTPRTTWPAPLTSGAKNSNRWSTFATAFWSSSSVLCGRWRRSVGSTCGCTKQRWRTRPAPDASRSPPTPPTTSRSRPTSRRPRCRPPYHRRRMPLVISRTSHQLLPLPTSGATFFSHTLKRAEIIIITRQRYHTVLSSVTRDDV